MRKNSEICLIAPSKSLANKAGAKIASMNEDIDVYVGDMEEATEIALELIKGGTKIFISRKGTKNILEKKLNVPIIGITVTMSDYVRVFERISHVKKRIAFFTYEEISEDVLLLCRLMNLDIKNYRFTSIADSEECVIKAIEEGAVYSVGGATTFKYAKQHGLPHIVIESSEDMIEAAIETAKQMLKVQKEEQKKQEELNLRLKRYELIFDYTHDGIIAINNDGKIDVLNNIAEKIINNPRKKPFVGKSIDAVVPNTRLIDVLKTGEPDINNLMEINGTLILTNRIPIKINSEVKGVVATFQDVKRIQAEEQKIRITMYEKGLSAKYHFSDIIGVSPAIENAKKIAKIFAQSNSTILIRGETGTGKELFAQSIHNVSSRKDSQFVAINCAALPKDLLQSELFGYVEGAFTGALKSGKAGVFEIAHGGTLFLDEIGEIDIATQTQLLRVLQEREVRRVGSDRVTPVDIRIIAATNRDLEHEMECGMFRQDLFYRLNVLNLDLPPLRSRREDVYVIAKAIAQELQERVTPSLIEKLFEILHNFEEYSWPGNIRELYNVVERAVVMLKNGISSNLVGDTLAIGIKDLKEHLNLECEQNREIKKWERDKIISSLQDNNLNISKTAKDLGVSRTTLWRKMGEYKISIK